MSKGEPTMPNDTQLILTAPPSCAAAAASHGLPVGHVAYRIGPGARLLRTHLPADLRGGLMVVDHSGFDGRGEALPVCQQIIRECGSRGFDGVILDWEDRSHPLLEQIVRRLATMLAHKGWPLYVTEPYAAASQQTRVIIPSALSGGSLLQRLREAIDCHGAHRVALGVQRTAEDFTLPAPDGCGKPLTRQQLAQRIAARGGNVFFSDELCAHYFTYMSRQSGAHFVLFDNAGSIRKKLQIAHHLGLCACILAWPEVDDIFPEILP